MWTLNYLHLDNDPSKPIPVTQIRFHESDPINYNKDSKDIKKS
jgi:hypothetical protein